MPTIQNPAMELTRMWLASYSQWATSSEIEVIPLTKEKIAEAYKYFHKETSDLMINNIDTLIEKYMPKIMELLDKLN